MLTLEFVLTWEKLYADLKVEAIALNPKTQEFTFEFSNHERPLTNATSAKLYWLRRFADFGDEPVEFYSLPIARGFSGVQRQTIALGEYLKVGPTNVKGVVLMLDPDNLVNESNETNNSEPPAQFPSADLEVGVQLQPEPDVSVLLPGMTKSVSVKVTNTSEDRFDGEVPLKLYLSTDAELDRTKDVDTLEPTKLRLNLAPKASVTLPIHARLTAGAPNLDRSGPRRLIARINEDRGVPESNYQNNEGFSEEFYMGYQVVTVVTHGFNPKPPPIEPWEVFRANWRALAEKFNTMAEPGSFLEHRVVPTLVAEWDSTTDFLPGFAALFAAKICDAGAADARTINDSLTEGFLLRAGTLLKGVVRRYAATSARYAEDAALNIVNRLLSSGKLLPDPKLSAGFQNIHLVGHSRGAAVNARVASLLASRGYLIHEYTALDGYSTDWPDDASLLGDISIVAESRAALTKVNYRVEAGIVDYVLGRVDEADRWLQVLAPPHPGPFIFQPTELKIDPGIRRELLKFDVRAPDRPGFRNVLFETGSEPSTHVSITESYLESQDHVYDNFLGRNRAIRGAPPVPNLDAAGSTARAMSALTASEHDAARIPDGGFVDGTFTESAAMMREAAELMREGSGNRLVDAWLVAAADPKGALRTAWTTTGEVHLVVQNSEALAELNQAPTAAIGSLVSALSRDGG